MSEKPQASQPVKSKSSIAVLRERHGGMTAELKEYFKEQQRVRKALRGALKGGPKTIPELAAACALEKPAAVWHVMAMRRYGEVVEGEERAGYMLYALKEA